MSPSPRLLPVSDRERFRSDELLPWAEAAALLWKVEELDRERFTHMELREAGLEEAD